MPDDSMPLASTLLRRVDAAHYVSKTWGMPLSPATLAKLAVVGGGPPFRKAGKFVLYSMRDLDNWVRGRLGGLQQSTSDVPATDSVEEAVPANSDACRAVTNGDFNQM